MNRSHLKNLFIQGSLALLLLISPVSRYYGSPTTGHPKVQTEWFSLKHNANSSTRVILEKRIHKTTTPSPSTEAVGAGKSGVTQKPKKNLPTTHTPQKTIPSGTEDELIA